MLCADDSDRATLIEEEERARKIKEAQDAAKVREKKPKGRCYYCDAEIPLPKLYCDRECAEDDELLKRARQRAEGMNW
jgi:predicted nucleic acid-binding Zn ribbon protein